ncbi:MAG TPA: hypothetical protein PKW37_00170 [Salinivirgaceae bacterium]|nr:hypothetical protein [Salinivirgaceae bacterium]
MVHGGGYMTKQFIIEAQEYLRIRTEYGCRRIIDVQSLMKNHNPGEVIRFLKDFLREKEKALKNMIQIDRNHPKVDRIVADMFRISMAVHTLKNGEEVIILERSQSGTEKSGGFHQRDSGGHSGSGERQDAGHDGKNRKPGQDTQRAA